MNIDVLFSCVGLMSELLGIYSYTSLASEWVVWAVSVYLYPVYIFVIYEFKKHILIIYGNLFYYVLRILEKTQSSDNSRRGSASFGWIRQLSDISAAPLCSHYKLDRWLSDS